MAKESMEDILRRKPEAKSEVNDSEKDAERIEIECVDDEPGKGYIVMVFPKDKRGKKGLGMIATVGHEPIKHIFKTEDETLEFIKTVL